MVVLSYLRFNPAMSSDGNSLAIEVFGFEAPTNLSGILHLKEGAGS